MIKEFLVRKMLESKMKDMPSADRDKLIKLVTNHPELFQKIATEVETRMKQGKDQMTAAIEVMKEHQEELKKLL